MVTRAPDVGPSMKSGEGLVTRNRMCWLSSPPSTLTTVTVSGLVVFSVTEPWYSRCWNTRELLSSTHSTVTRLQTTRGRVVRCRLSRDVTQFKQVMYKMTKLSNKTRK